MRLARRRICLVGGLFGTWLALTAGCGTSQKGFQAVPRELPDSGHAGPTGGPEDSGSVSRPEAQDSGSTGPVFGIDASAADGGACPAGEHDVDDQCVSDEVMCGSEFPCPMSEQCVGGLCATTPASCTNNNMCPSGFVCQSGACVPVCSGSGSQCTVDSNCASGELCVSCQCVGASSCPVMTPDLSGAVWTAQSDLDLSQALGAFGQAFTSILEDLRDAIDGCPNGGFTCGLLTLVVPYIPTWLQQLIVGVANFGNVLDNNNFLVTSTMAFTPSGNVSAYNVQETWTQLSFSYMGQQVTEAPQAVPQINMPVTMSYGANAACGVLYMDQHTVNGALSGILQWVLETVTTLASNGQCTSLPDCITSNIDCTQVPNAAAEAACVTLLTGLDAELTNAINSWLLNYSLMTLTGTATVDPSGNALNNGQWDGTLGDGSTIFNNFTGTWSATR
jgi:hypothetical protein